MGVAHNHRLIKKDPGIDEKQQISSLDCDKSDSLNTSYAPVGIVGLAALNPVLALLVGGITYVVADTTNPECQNISKEP